MTLTLPIGGPQDTFLKADPHAGRLELSRHWDFQCLTASAFGIQFPLGNWVKYSGWALRHCRMTAHCSSSLSFQNHAGISVGICFFAIVGTSV
jgi:hypothetical protein